MKTGYNRLLFMKLFAGWHIRTLGENSNSELRVLIEKVQTNGMCNILKNIFFYSFENSSDVLK